MASLDRKLAEKTMRRVERLAKEEERVKRHKTSTSSASTNTESTENDYVGGESDKDDEDFVVSDRPQKPENILGPELVATCDRVNLSSRGVVRVVAATAKALGHDLDDFAINKSSVHRTRSQNRKKIAEDIKENFDGSGSKIVLWDGKHLPDLTGQTKEQIIIKIIATKTYLTCIAFQADSWWTGFL